MRNPGYKQVRMKNYTGSNHIINSGKKVSYFSFLRKRQNQVRFKTLVTITNMEHLEGNYQPPGGTPELNCQDPSNYRRCSGDKKKIKDWKSSSLHQQ